MTKAVLSQDELRAMVSYDPETGKFTWLRRSVNENRSLQACEAWNGQWAGKTAGGITNGYVSLSILNTTTLAHRLAWLYMTGSWPAGEIDHINGCRTDNRFINLRDVDRRTNQENMRTANKRATALPLGVYFVSRKVQRRYTAKIKVNGISKHLGYFDTPEDAHAAYLLEKRQSHAGCTI